MPGLAIEIVDGTWTAIIEDTGWSKAFVGDTLETQALWVNAFAEQMSAGEAMNAASALVGTIDELSATAEMLFASTDALIFDGVLAFAAEAGSLMESLVEAGEALLALL